MSDHRTSERFAPFISRWFVIFCAHSELFQRRRTPMALPIPLLPLSCLRSAEDKNSNRESIRRVGSIRKANGAGLSFRPAPLGFVLLHRRANRTSGKGYRRSQRTSSLQRGMLHRSKSRRRHADIAGRYAGHQLPTICGSHFGIRYRTGRLPKPLSGLSRSSLQSKVRRNPEASGMLG